MLGFSRIGATTAAIFVAATSLMLGVAGGGAPTLLSSCHDPMVYDPKIDEIIPAYLVQGLESAVPPVQPGDKLTYRPASLAGVLLTVRRTGAAVGMLALSRSGFALRGCRGLPSTKRFPSAPARPA